MPAATARPSGATRAASGPVASGWCVDGLRPGDRDALDTLFARCSPETVRLRFFGRLHRWPAPYLDSVLAGPAETHDAVVVRNPEGDQVLALAGLVAVSDTVAGAAELGVLVADAWQRQGLGSAMLEVLLDRARRRGVRRVCANALPGRQALLAALARRLELERSAWTEGGLVGVYKLAGIVE
ncbi:GNAT family N-acetyltransferase [Streptomyces sp. ICBB 8177]|uniref:GNAT family N-acetyltransferase n=1 Tax=Streptomyces sp. ICBB 8177 TaxID=563922 RepID=UPI0018EEBFD3|nr:GNAT family N-acetyltransferase [Streptomyces sp. ICBB 8177]